GAIDAFKSAGSVKSAASPAVTGRDTHFLPGTIVIAGFRRVPSHSFGDANFFKPGSFQRAIIVFVDHFSHEHPLVKFFGGVLLPFGQERPDRVQVTDGPTTVVITRPA